jgi:hypothetical protein
VGCVVVVFGMNNSTEFVAGDPVYFETQSNTQIPSDQPLSRPNDYSFTRQKKLTTPGTHDTNRDNLSTDDQSNEHMTHLMHRHREQLRGIPPAHA